MILGFLFCLNLRFPLVSLFYEFDCFLLWYRGCFDWISSRSNCVRCFCVLFVCRFSGPYNNGDRNFFCSSAFAASVRRKHFGHAAWPRRYGRVACFVSGEVTALCSFNFVSDRVWHIDSVFEYSIFFHFLWAFEFFFLGKVRNRKWFEIRIIPFELFLRYESRHLARTMLRFKFYGAYFSTLFFFFFFFF